MWKCVLHECNSAGYYIPGKKPLFVYSEVFLGLYVLIMTLSPSFSVSAADPLLGFRDCFFVLMCTNNRSLIGHHDSIPLSFLHFPSKSKMPWRKEKKKNHKEDGSDHFPDFALQAHKQPRASRSRFWENDCCVHAASMSLIFFIPGHYILSAQAWWVILSYLLLQVLK